MQQTAENYQISLEDVEAFLAERSVDKSVQPILFQYWFLYLNQITEVTKYGIRLKNEKDIPSLKSLENGDNQFAVDEVLYCLSINLLKEFTDAYNGDNEGTTILFNQLWCIVRHAGKKNQFSQ